MVANNMYEKMGLRLTFILSKLSDNKYINVDDLADELKVSRRTIQRDLKKIAESFPIKKYKGTYSLSDTKEIGAYNIKGLLDITQQNKIDKPNIDFKKFINKNTQESQKIDVVIKIDNQIVKNIQKELDFFEKIEINSNIFSIKIYKEQLFQLIKCNLPFIHIIKPFELKQELSKDLLEYLN